MSYFRQTERCVFSLLIMLPFLSAPLSSSQHSFRPNFLATAQQLKEEGFKVSVFFFFFVHVKGISLLFLTFCVCNHVITFLFCSCMLLKPLLPGCVPTMCLPHRLPGPLRRTATLVCPVLRGWKMFTVNTKLLI